MNLRWFVVFVLFLTSKCFAQSAESIVQMSAIDSIVAKPKLFGSVLRTVREVHFTGDSIPEIFQVETSKAKKLSDIHVRFGVYRQGKLIYQKKWKADDFFDPADKWDKTVKWRFLQHVLKVFFSDQNFTPANSESFESLFSRVQPVDIIPNSALAKEIESSNRLIFALYAGRENLVGITWLASQNKIVTLWRN
ncbi:MAG: hypothetical protein WCH46_02165 [bacterium]